jgi:hypothetical protein
MSDAEKRFHETWLGMVQPVDGLVVSVPALVAAQCMERQGVETQRKLHELCPEFEEGSRRIADLGSFLEQLLGFTPNSFDRGETLPDDLQLYVAEGQQTIRPSLALRKLDPPPTDATEPGTPRLDDSTPASRAGQPYAMLLWQLPDDLELDKPETSTGPWHYPPAAKFDRLLRECRVPIGLLVNGRSVRLMYCPHGESSGAMTFRIDDMAEVGGRPILDAFLMLLHEFRWFGVEPERALPAILADSRARQADVTDALADQLFEALTILLAGFEAAAERQEQTAARLADALSDTDSDDDLLYGGLLTLLLRLVFLLYAEDRDLMPMDHPVYGQHLSVLALYDELQSDHALFPDTMAQRFGAYPRLLAAFRAVFYGLRHDDLYIPPRHGALFDPERYPFLEGWDRGGAAPVDPEARAALHVPSISDETVYRVLERLLILGGQRLSYRALEVEQIGSVYEALMGYHVIKIPAAGGAAVCLRPAKVWVSAGEVLAVSKGQRLKWLQARGLTKDQATKLSDALAAAKGQEQALAALQVASVKSIAAAAPGRLVIQPGEERRRTSSHYTPRSLSEPIVQRTLEPLIAAMDENGEPSSEKLLRLKVCDPAMGSGAFLVAAVRFLADQVVAAWTREKVLEQIVDSHEDPVMYARRLVAQRCIYGVDKNPFAVNLAKLSLWLETLARGEPFTFVDHALKCGDSLVGLDLEQIKAFDWVKEDTPPKRGKQGKQLDLFEGVIERALLHAYSARRKLLELAEVQGDRAEITARKEALHEEAELALERARMIGDCIVGAFFAEEKDKARRGELAPRRAAVAAWLLGGNDAVAPVSVRQWVAQIREEVRPFHWWLEFPEVFWVDRKDPLEADRLNKNAWIDAVMGNPPFMGGSSISGHFSPSYLSWLLSCFAPAHGGSDYSGYFLRRADGLIGAHGTIGFITTNTIAQGDTRRTALQPLAVALRIYYANPSLPWPGTAHVAVAVIHLAKGTVQVTCPQPILEGRSCPAISSRLRPTPERPDPQSLSENSGLCFGGSKIYGQGFLLSPEEYESLLLKNQRNGERMFPYIGGEELNTSPTQSHHRYVINFGTAALSDIRAWPDLLSIVEQRVKPERDKRDHNAIAQRQKEYWWRFRSDTPRLRESISRLARCLANSQVSKHVVFAFQPIDRIYAHTLNIFAIQHYSQFAALQSRCHESWARLLSSSLEDRLRYAPTDCFENFPFPLERQHSPTSLLEQIGQQLYTTRAQYMIGTEQGLTKTYNALKDPSVTEARIVHLRDLHVEMDRTVLAAYGWSDIEVPPYTDPVTPAEQSAHQAFEDEVIDRLFVLNAERAAQEAKLGTKKVKKAKKASKD